MENMHQQSEIKMRHLPAVDRFKQSEIKMRHLPAVDRFKRKARLKCATYRRYTDLSVMGVRVGVANLFLDQSIG